jgi:hypothetical protein
MPSSIPENFEKENEVANEPVTKEVVDGGIGSGWNTTGDQAEYCQIHISILVPWLCSPLCF